MPGVNKFILPILSSELFIADDFALQAWARYRATMEQASAGVTWEQMGIPDRKRATLPQTISGSGEVSAGLSSIDFQDSIALIKLSGVMEDEGGLCNRGAEDIESDFRLAYSNPSISAIVFEVNSGGGMAAAGWRLNSVIKEKNKPVLGFIRDAGSAALLAAVACNELMAMPQASVGSIGAYVPIDKLLMQLLAEDIEFVYADQSINKNGAFMAAIRGDYGPLKAQVTKTAAAFIKEVETQRTLNETYKADTLAGAMFIASDAKKRGLIDSTGNFTDAMKRAKLLGKRHKQAQNAQ